LLSVGRGPVLGARWTRYPTADRCSNAAGRSGPTGGGLSHRSPRPSCRADPPDPPRHDDASANGATCCLSRTPIGDRSPILCGHQLTGVGRFPNLAGGPAGPATRETLPVKRAGRGAVRKWSGRRSCDSVAGVRVCVSLATRGQTDERPRSQGLLGRALGTLPTSGQRAP